MNDTIVKWHAFAPYKLFYLRLRFNRILGFSQFILLLFVLKQKVTIPIAIGTRLDLFAKKVSITLKDLNSRGLETCLNNEICAALKQKIFLNASLQLFLHAKISEVGF